MERIDKFISNLGYWSRKDVVKYVKDGIIALNGEIIDKPNVKVDFWDMVEIWEEEIEVMDKVYVLLNKDKWYVSSRKEEWGHLSYLELVEDCPYANLLNPVWRLDHDTTGLLILTNDGDLVHRLTSPKKDIYKTYKVIIESPLSDKNIKDLENWVKINVEKEAYITKPSVVNVIDDKTIELSITEGKFHQVKKMLEAISNKVLELHRISIWDFKLDDSLEVWDWRYISEDEIKKYF